MEPLTDLLIGIALIIMYGILLGALAVTAHIIRISFESRNIDPAYEDEEQMFYDMGNSHGPRSSNSGGAQ